MKNIPRTVKLQSLLIDINELSEDERKIFNYLGSSNNFHDSKYYRYYNIDIKSNKKSFKTLYAYNEEMNIVYIYFDMLKLANINYKDGNILMLFKKILILYCNFDDTLDVMLC